MSKNALGLFSAKPPPRGWSVADTSAAQRRIEATALEVAADGEGIAIVDAFTIDHDREAGPVRAPAYATLEDGRRVVAVPATPDLPRELSGRNIVSETIRVRSGEGGTTYELL
jgi:hypothetical protein